MCENNITMQSHFTWSIIVEYSGIGRCFDKGGVHRTIPYIDMSPGFIRLSEIDSEAILV